MRSTRVGADEADPVAPAAPVAAARRWREVRRRFLRQRGAVVALVVLVVVVAVSVGAPLVAPYDPTTNDLRNQLASSNWAHLFGTDDLGRDVFSRLLYAGAISLYAAFVATIVALAVGLPLGLVAGYFGRWPDLVISRFNDALMSFPAILLAITIVGLVGPGLTNAMVAVGIVFGPRFMRVVRGAVLEVRAEDYVAAAHMIGSGSWRTIRKHVLPNVLSPLIVQVSLTMGLALLAEASLSFLGLGVQPPEASWGSMLRRGFTYVNDAPLASLAPGFLIMVTVLCFNVIGDGVRDSFGREERRAA